MACWPTRKHRPKLTTSVPIGNVSPNRLATTPDVQRLAWRRNRPNQSEIICPLILLEKAELLTISRTVCRNDQESPTLLGGYVANSIAKVVALFYIVFRRPAGRGAPLIFTGSCGAQHTFTNRSRSRCISRSLPSHVKVSLKTRAASGSSGSTIR